MCPHIDPWPIYLHTYALFLKYRELILQIDQPQTKTVFIISQFQYSVGSADSVLNEKWVRMSHATIRFEKMTPYDQSLTVALVLG